jgi:lysozyme
VDQAKLRAELIRDEGLRFSAYQDTNGFWTIGVGHLLGTEKRMLKITNEEVMALLDVDIREALTIVNRVFPEGNLSGNYTRLTDAQLRALVNMAFNRGEKRMMESTTITPAIRKAIETGDWSSVTLTIMTSPWAKQIGKRAERLAYMLETGKDLQ